MSTVSTERAYDDWSHGCPHAGEEQHFEAFCGGWYKREQAMHGAVDALEASNVALRDRCDDLRIELGELIAVLRFYANGRCGVYGDGGERARAVLAKYANEDEGGME